MSDQGHELTEELLGELEGEIKDEYQKALKDIEKKLQDYLEKTEIGRQEQQALLDAGKITQKEYNDWVYRHTMVGKRWEDMRDTLAKDFVRADATAQGLIKGKMPDVYALNMNYATYQVERDGRIDTGFTLYNHDTAEYLLKDQRELMPGPSTKKSAQIRANKDMQWNKQHIQSAVLQGVLQGESPYDVAARLRQVGQMDASASIRYARTMTTSAQNAGRYEAYRRAKDLGVQLTIEWQATLDGRTRHEHRMMHGQRREVDEPFVVDGIKILYPAEGGPGAADIPQRLIWNCRCTLLSWVKGFEGDTVKSSPKMEGMTFEEWQVDKAPSQGLAKLNDTKEPAFVSGFTPAQSLAEAEDAVRRIVDDTQFGAVGVSFAGLNLDAANAISKRLIDFYDEFDVGKFGGIIAPAGNTKLGQLVADARAGYSPVRNSFILNRKALKSVQAATDDMVKEHAAVLDMLTHPEKYDWDRAKPSLKRIIAASSTSGRATVPRNLDEAIDHELGHALEKKLKRHEAFEQIKENMAQYAPKVSGYACEDASEYLAESFASWRKGEAVADPVLVGAFKSLRRKK